MLPDRVSNPRPLTYESGALPIALRGPATALGHGQIYREKNVQSKRKVSIALSFSIITFKVLTIS